VELLLWRGARDMGAARRESYWATTISPSTSARSCCRRATTPWTTSGTRSGSAARASNDIVVDGAFVPAHRALSFNDVTRCACPGQERNAGPLYRIPYGSVFTYAITAPVIGMATGAYQAHVAYQRDRVRAAYAGEKAGDDPFGQVRVAEAAGLLDAAWLALERNMAQLMAHALAGEKRRSRCGCGCGGDQVTGTAQAVRVVDLLFENSGGRALKAGTPAPSGSGGTRTPAGCTRSTTRSARCRCSGARRVRGATSRPARCCEGDHVRRAGLHAPALRASGARSGQGTRWSCLHGGGPGAAGMSNFRRNLPVFAERFRTLVVDQPGFGKSDKTPVEGNYFTFAAQALAGLLERAWRRPGCTWWQLARRRPPRSGFALRYPERGGGAWC